jgi:hypothetical protein
LKELCSLTLNLIIRFKLTGGKINMGIIEAVQEVAREEGEHEKALKLRFA